MKSKIVLTGFVLAVIACIAYYFYSNITLNFTVLAILYVIGVVFLSWIYSVYKKKSFVDEQVRLGSGIVIISLAVLFTCQTLSNYFFARNEVYSNSDHHAVRIDGANIHNPRGFVVAGDSENAFFDNNNFQGTIRIKEFDANNVVLKLDGFTQALYLESYGKESKLTSSELLNKETLIPVQATDKLQFIGEKDTCELAWRYNIEKNWIKKNIAECNYIYTYKGVRDTVSENRIIKKGLDLNTVLGEVVSSNISFKGVNLLRSRHDTETESAEYYKNEAFVIELNRAVFDQTSINEIRVLSVDGNVNSYKMNTLKRKTEEVIIPINKAFSIGCLAGLKTLPIRFKYTNESLSLEYVTPQYHHLSSLNKEGSNTLFITTSLSREIIEDQNPPENIMLFDFFSSEKNGNNFQSPIYLSYIAGPTTQEMGFLINRETKLKAGELIPNIKSQNGSITWNIEVENFKETSRHIKENNILIFIIILGACCLINTVFGRSMGGVKYHTLIEQVAYMVLLLFFSFRLLLMWRAAMFPPAELASIYEFLHFFRNEGAILVQCVGLNFFFAAIQSVKLILQPIHGRIGLKIAADFIRLALPTLFLTVAEMFVFHITDMRLFVIPFATYLVLVCLFLIFKRYDEPLAERIYKNWAKFIKGKYWFGFVFGLFFLLGLSVSCFKYISFVPLKMMLPLCLYFFFEFFIWRYWPASDNGIYQESGRANRFTFSQIFSSGLGLSFMNGLTFSIAFFRIDGGYGIMFLSFFMFVTVLKLYDFVKSFYRFDDEGGRIKKIVSHIVVIFGLPIAFALFFFCYQDILAWLATHSNIPCILAIAGVLSLVLWIVVLYIGGINLIKSPINLLRSVLSVLIVSVAFTFVFKEIVLTKHTAQRVMVHVLGLQEGLKNTKTAEDERRFFEASVNDYILNVYNRQGDEVNAIGGEGKAYFKMQQHSRVGAMFGAQTSDILPARFIIAEHGKLLTVLFIFFFLFMLSLGVAMRTKYRVSKMLLIQIPSLLFIHSLFVWLANTQMFFFLGQDFPLLSLHSKFTILYYFVLMALWVCVATVEKIEVIKQLAEPEEYPCYYHMVLGVTLGVILMGMLTLFYWKYAPEKDKNYNENRQYTLNKLLKDTKDKITQLNEEFAKFQDSTKIVTPNLSDVSVVVAAFNEEYNSFIKSTLGNDSTFHYRLWERFAVKGGAKSNERNSLIHVRRKDNVLQFAVRTNYFDRNLPTVEANTWRGSVVASNNKNREIKTITQNNEFRQYVLPRSWVNSADDVIILKLLSKQETTIGNDVKDYTDFTLESGYAFACRRFPYDRFNDKDLERFAADTYFARNVVINGRRSFVYPMAEDFFWSYTFANEVAKQKNVQKVQPASFHNDIAITLDRRLTSDIYELAGKALDRDNLDAPYMSVVVADGDGQIRVMVDRKREFVLNPNNTKELNKIADDLYMNFDSEKNDAYFGNMNLFAMPDGPGSSQKPIVWSAVASGIDYDWKNLQIFKFTDQSLNIGLGLTQDGRYYFTRFFNGERLYLDGRDSGNTFNALRSDENYGSGVNLRNYMRKSSNYYNALMLYIGSFQSFNMGTATKNRPDSTAMFVALRRNEIHEAPDSVFPILAQSQQNDNSLFKLNQKMSRDYENSLLFTRLHSMFGFNSGEKFSSLYEGANLSSLPDERLSSYAFVANPNYTYNLRSSSDREFLLNAIHYAAVGGGIPWQVSPLSMAQIFGQLTMLKKNYKLTLEPIKEGMRDFQPYTDLSEGYLEAREEFLLGMNEVFSSTGTASAFGAQKEGEVMKKGGYFIYGKTGTSNEIGTSNANLHRLGVVITNKQIESLDVKELKEVKFYTVYFTARYNKYTNYYGQIVDKIIASDSFKQYMNVDDKQNLKK